MSPLNPTTIAQKLDVLEETITKLKELRDKKELFFSDYIVRDATMRNLTVGIESIVDIGNHILSEIFHNPAKEYKQIIQHLGAYKVIPENFSKEHENMAGFRHRLIHDYAEIDYTVVYDTLQKAPEIFQQFAGHYINFLEKQR